MYQILRKINGRIVCGYIKLENKFVDYLNEILGDIPNDFIWNENSGIVIDGEFQVIRSYSKGKLIKEVAFHNEIPNITDDYIRKNIVDLVSVLGKKIDLSIRNVRYNNSSIINDTGIKDECDFTNESYDCNSKKKFYHSF